MRIPLSFLVRMDWILIGGIVADCEDNLEDRGRTGEPRSRSRPHSMDGPVLVSSIS